MMMTGKLVYDNLNRLDGGYAQQNPPYKIIDDNPFDFRHRLFFSTIDSYYHAMERPRHRRRFNVCD